MSKERKNSNSFIIFFVNPCFDLSFCWLFSSVKKTHDNDDEAGAYDDGTETTI